jgi:ABC-type nickel/cobalt efflux system permease component RcnA
MRCQVKAVRFLREHISLHMPVRSSPVSAAFRLAWKMLRDSIKDGYTSNCTTTVVYMTDGLLEADEAWAAVLAVNELQAYTHNTQTHAHTQKHTYTHTHTHTDTHTHKHTHTHTHTYMRELQAAEPTAQVFAISVGEQACPLCDDLICRLV